MMDPTVKVAIITAMGPTGLGLLTLLHQVIMARKVEAIKVQTNHLTSALVAKTEIASHAEGVQDEKIRVAIKESRPLDTVISGTKIGLLMLLTGVLGAILEHIASKL